MPAKDYNEYMRVYMNKRYRKRMDEAILKLGGECAKCKSTKRLELDHIDHKTKSFTIARMWSVSYVRFEAELAKCQLLCRKCHKRKTLNDLGQQDARKTHGTLSSYRYCKCALCRAANAKYHRERKAAL